MLCGFFLTLHEERSATVAKGWLMSGVPSQSIQAREGGTGYTFADAIHSIIPVI